MLQDTVSTVDGHEDVAAHVHAADILHVAISGARSAANAILFGGVTLGVASDADLLFEETIGCEVVTSSKRSRSTDRSDPKCVESDQEEAINRTFSLRQLSCEISCSDDAPGCVQDMQVDLAPTPCAFSFTESPSRWSVISASRDLCDDASQALLLSSSPASTKSARHWRRWQAIPLAAIFTFLSPHDLSVAAQVRSPQLKFKTIECGVPKLCNRLLSDLQILANRHKMCRVR